MSKGEITNIIMTLSQVNPLYPLHSQLALQPPHVQLSYKRCKKRRVIEQHGVQLLPILLQRQGLMHITPNFIPKRNPQNYHILQLVFKFRMQYIE